MVTYDDASLVVQLLQWGSQMGLDEALAEIFEDDFDADAAKGSDPAVRKVLYWGETIGTFVKQGVLNRDLVYDLWAMEFSWKKVGPAALKIREKAGEPRLYENYEALAKAARVTAGV